MAEFLKFIVFTVLVVATRGQVDDEDKVREPLSPEERLCDDTALYQCLADIRAQLHNKTGTGATLVCDTGQLLYDQVSVCVWKNRCDESLMYVAEAAGQTRGTIHRGVTLVEEGCRLHSGAGRTSPTIIPVLISGMLLLWVFAQRRK